MHVKSKSLRHFKKKKTPKSSLKLLEIQKLFKKAKN